MPDGDTPGLTASRARLDRARRALLLELRAARISGTPRWELAEDLAALRRAGEALLALLP